MMNGFVDWLLSLSPHGAGFFAMYSLLIQTTVYLSVTAVLIVVFKLIFRNRMRAKWHFLIWAILLVRLLVPAFPSSPVSVFNTIKVEDSAIERSSEIARITTPDADTVSRHTSKRAESAEKEEPPKPAELTQTEESVPQSSVSVIYVDRIVVSVWAGGALLLLGYLLTVFCVYRHRLKKRRSPANESALAVLSNCTQRIKTKRKVRLFFAGTTPTLTGLFKPAIYISSDLNESELEATLLHELSHMKHFDILWSAIAAIVLCLNWFNPIIWLCFFIFKRDVELYCDERTLRYTGDRQSYALLLLNTAAGKRYVFGTTSLSSGKSDVKRRIRYLAKFKKPRVIIAVLAVLAAVIIGALCLTNATQYVAERSVETARTSYSDYCAEKAANFEYDYLFDSSAEDYDRFNHDRSMANLRLKELDDVVRKMQKDNFRVKKDRVGDTLTEYYIYSADEYFFISNHTGDEYVYNDLLWYASSSSYKLRAPDNETVLKLIKDAGGDTSFGCAVDASSDALYELTGSKLIYVPKYNDDEWSEIQTFLVNNDGAVEIRNQYYEPYVCDIDSDGNYEVITLTDEKDKDCLTAYGFDKGAPYVKYRELYGENDDFNFGIVDDIWVGENGKAFYYVIYNTPVYDSRVDLSTRSTHRIVVENGKFVFEEVNRTKAMTDEEEKALKLDLSLNEYNRLVETLTDKMLKSEYGLYKKCSAILDINGDNVPEFVQWYDIGSGVVSCQFEAYRSSGGELELIGFGSVNTNGVGTDAYNVISSGKPDISPDGKALIFTYDKQTVRVTMDGDIIRFYSGNSGIETKDFVSQMYNEDDFDEAVQTVIDDFNSLGSDYGKIGGVGTLHSLTYLGDDFSKKELAYCNKLREKGEPEYKQCMVFGSLFHTDKDGAAAWVPDEDYTWTWHLAKVSGGKWKVISRGY